MNKILRMGLVIAAVVALFSTAAFCQTTTGFAYVFPNVTAPGLQLVIANISGSSAAVRVTFYSQSGAVVQTLLFAVAAGNQTIVDDTRVSLGSFVGSAVVESATPLAVNDTTNTSTTLDSAGPAATSNELIIPFVRAGVNGDTTISVFNPGPQTANVVVLLGKSDGTLINGYQALLGTKESRHVSVSSLAVSPVDLDDITYAIVRSLGSVLLNARPVAAEAEVNQFSTITGIQTSDLAVVTAVPSSNLTSTAVLPLFVQGMGYFTQLEVVNNSDATQAVTMVARSTSGGTIPGGTNPVTVSILPHGTYSQNVASAFNLSADSMGSISVSGSAALTVVGALGSTVAPGLTMIQAAGAPTFLSALQYRSVSQLFSGLSFVNPNSVDTVVSLTFITSDGFTISTAQLTVPAGGQRIDTLGNLLPEAFGAGYIFVSSTQPILLSAIEGAVDASVLSPLPVTTITSGFNPPAQQRFLAVGTATVNGVPIPGATVVLSGPSAGSQITDSNGAFVFRDIPPGAYTVSIQLAGITFTPSSIPFTVTNQNVRNINFTGSIVGSSLTSITPSSVLVGSGNTQITAKGGPFIPSSQIVVDGTAIPTTFVDQNTLTGVISATALRFSRVATVQVQNRVGTNVAPSQPLPFVVGNPAPVITAVSGIPSQIVAGYPGFSVIITGTGFNAGGTVEFAGVPRPFVFDSPTQIRAFIGPADLAVGQVASLTATNPSPTIGPSNAIKVTVFNPVAGLLSILPSTTEIKIEPNSTGLQLIVNGFQFKNGATVQVGGFPALTTIYVNSTQLMATIPPEALQIAGSLPVTVTNPAPNLGSSEVQPLIVQNLVPQLASIDTGPLTFSPGITEDQTVPVNFVAVLHGSNFGKEYTAVMIAPASPFPSCNEQTPIALSPQVISSTEMVVTLPIKCTGNFNVYVSSPQQEPGGGTSGIITFGVSPPIAGPVPILSSLSPIAITAGTAFTLTINGNNFQAGALVNFGTAILTPTSITGSSVTVNVPAYYVPISGVIPVTVTNPGTGGTSTRLLFFVN